MPFELSTKPESSHLLNKSDERWAGMARQEAGFGGSSIHAFKKAAVEAFDGDHWLGTSGNLAVSFGIGLAMARFAPARGALGMVARAAGSAMLLGFASELRTKSKELMGAWGDSSKAGDIAGRLAFDTALMTVAGVGGQKLGSRVFGRRSGTSLPETAPHPTRPPILPDQGWQGPMASDSCRNPRLLANRLNVEKPEPFIPPLVRMQLPPARWTPAELPRPDDLGKARLLELFREPARSHRPAPITISPEQILQKDVASIVRISATHSDGMPAHGGATGFFVRPDGKIATAFHCVGDFVTGQRYKNIRIKLNNGVELPADIVGINQPRDLAILQVTQKRHESTSFRFPVLELSRVKPQPGSPAVALGFPGTALAAFDPALYRLEVRSSVLGAGIAAEGRTVPGCSGGPILNPQNEVVGLVSSGSYERLPTQKTSGPSVRSIRALLNAVETNSDRALLLWDRGVRTRCDYYINRALFARENKLF